MTTELLLKTASDAKKTLPFLTTEQKNAVLLRIADRLEEDAECILRENQADLENAVGKISDVMLDRLRLTHERIEDMANGVRTVASLPDPVGRILSDFTNRDGLHIQKKSVPLGVIAIIYESRPNVTSDAGALCLKSGNVCILRSGKEAYRSAHAIVSSMKQALTDCNLPENLINIVDDPTRESANALMTANGFVDLLIPRGGAGLIRSCVENATVPCIETGTGICSVYVDEYADLTKAVNIIINAKTQRPSVCNAEETCLVNEKIAKKLLPMLKKALVDDRIAEGKTPVELRLCEKSAEIIPGVLATDADFDTEFLDYILAVRIVADVTEAVAHISAHSTHHSEAIITENRENADYFTNAVDSTAVYVNASTRFTDGGVFGLGCEMGISTQKLHARGPMGLCELTTYKYIIQGEGQVRK